MILADQHPLVDATTSLDAAERLFPVAVDAEQLFLQDADVVQSAFPAVQLADVALAVVPQRHRLHSQLQSQ